MIAPPRVLPVARVLDAAVRAQAPSGTVTAEGVRSRTFAITGAPRDGASADALHEDLGAALRAAHDWITDADEHGPAALQPLVAILLAEAPTGEWRGVAEGFRVMAEMRLVNVIGFAFSEEALHALARVTPTLVAVEAAGAAEILDWVDRTAAAAARSTLAARSGKPVRAPSLPAGARRAA